MYRKCPRVPKSKNYVPKWYVPKVSCTDMDLSHLDVTDEIDSRIVVGSLVIR